MTTWGLFVTATPTPCSCVSTSAVQTLSRADSRRYLWNSNNMEQIFELAKWIVLSLWEYWRLPVLFIHLQVEVHIHRASYTDTRSHTGKIKQSLVFRSWDEMETPEEDFCCYCIYFLFYDRLKALLIEQTCLSLSVFVQWKTEIMDFCPNTRILLVGCKTDLRTDVCTLMELSNQKQTPITQEQVRYLSIYIQFIAFTVA